MSDFYDFDNGRIEDNSRTDFSTSSAGRESGGTDTGKPVLSEHLDMIDFEKEIQREPDFDRRSMQEVKDPDYYPVSGDDDYRSSRTGSGHSGGQDDTRLNSQTGGSYHDQDGRNVTMENQYNSQFASEKTSRPEAPRNNGRYSFKNSSRTEGTGGGPGGPDGPDYHPFTRIPDDPGRRRQRKNSPFKGFVTLVAGAVLFGIIAGITMVGVNKISGGSSSGTTSQRIETTTDSADSKGTESGSQKSADSEDTVTKVVQQVMPSVVSITGTYQTQGFFGFDGGEQQGAGSGFIIAQDDKSILIATNNHVVQNSTALTVGFVDGNTAAASIVGTDSEADLAVIAVKASDLKKETISKIKVAVLGDSDKLEVGQPVIAIGNALGYGQSVTTGVISAKNREVSFTDGTMTLLQTDAAINPGNSGGVLCDTSGKVIGINNAKLEDTSVEGMCYAIPITTANTILTDLMNAGSINADDASYLGIVGKTIDASTSAALGMPSGVYVSQVVSGSPAEKAGISAGDVITAFNGNNVSTMDGLKSKLSAKAAGTEITLTIQRANQNGEYEKKNVKVTLGKKSDYEKEASENQQDQQQNQQQDRQQNGNGNSRGTDPYDYFFGNGDGSGQGDGFNDDGQDGNSDSGNPFEYFFNNY